MGGPGIPLTYIISQAAQCPVAGPICLLQPLERVTTNCGQNNRSAAFPGPEVVHRAGGCCSTGLGLVFQLLGCQWAQAVQPSPQKVTEASQLKASSCACHLDGVVVVLRPTQGANA